MNQIAATKEPEEGSQKTNEAVSCEEEDPMEQESVIPATVFCIRLRQPKSNLLYKMSVPEICRNFSAVSWCGKLNAIACASETCARIPSSTGNPPFWIPIHIMIPERPTECAVFNVIAGILMLIFLLYSWMLQFTVLFVLFDLILNLTGLSELTNCCKIRCLSFPISL